MIKSWSTYHYLLLTSFSIFLIIVSPSLFSEGMFLDGTLYAGVSKNLAHGLGDFWNLHYTQTVYPVFHEHPPLVFGIQSIFFTVFGDYFWVERIYSFLCFICYCYLTLKLWKLLVGNMNQAWLIVLFYALIPLITWSTANNILENTMSIFTLYAAYCYFSYQKSSKKFYLIVGGVSIALAFLCKGFTGLFVWVLPFAFFLFSKEKEKEKEKVKFKWKFLLEQVVFIGSTLMFFLILFFIYPPSFESLTLYFERQVVGSLKNIETVNSRFYILSKLITELLIPFGLILILYLWKREVRFVISRSTKRLSLILIFTGLAGVVPILISMKQSGFYILCTFPFFILAFNLLIKSKIDFFHDLLLKQKSHNNHKFLRSISICTFVVSLVISTISFVSVSRDKDKLQMVKMSASFLQNQDIILIEKHLMEDWSWHAYYMRYLNVSLSDDHLENASFLLSNNDKPLDILVKSGKFFLYKLKL